MRIVIFANGTLNQPQKIRSLLQPDDFILAADGGALHALACEVMPAMIVGDLDSIPADLLARFQTAAVRLEQYPPRKDETDLELALAFAVQRFPKTPILLLTALGGRWDMTLANILLLAHPRWQHASITLLDDTCQITLLHGGRAATLSGQPGDTVSLIPIRGAAEGITTTGLEYPLKAETLQFAATRGISNVLTQPQATIALLRGLLCIVHTFQS
ncbi:MAG: thiamine diphosphokinase [Anaerolineales bacterium]